MLKLRESPTVVGHWASELHFTVLLPFQLPLSHQKVASACGPEPDEHSATLPPTCCPEYACVSLGAPPLATMREKGEEGTWN